MSTETVVLTHQDIRLRENFYRIETSDDVVALLRNLLAHCNEHQLPFDDCVGEAVTAPPLAPTCRKGDLKEGDIVVAAFGSGVSEYQVEQLPNAVWVRATSPSGRENRCIEFRDIVHIGTKKEYQRLVKERKQAEEARRKLEGR
jgi:hypothetical protein